MYKEEVSILISLENLTTHKKESLLEFNIFREKLLRYLEDYQINLNNIGNDISEKANEKAKMILASEYDPELKEDANNVKRGEKTRKILECYRKNIMLILGNICECIIIDNCKRDPTLNMKCINYACFKEDINKEYKDIQYNEYTALSPSHKRIVLYSDGGIIHYIENKYAFEPNHINKDIIWCNKNSLEDILNAKIPFTQYSSPARLQIKTSTNYRNIKWYEKKYQFSPIIYFDLYRDINDLYDYLEKKNSNLYVKSVLDFDIKLMRECIWYYKLLAGHFSGIINLKKVINLDSLNVLNKAIIQYIFRTDIKALINDKSVVKSEQLLEKLQNTILLNNKNIINIEMK